MCRLLSPASCLGLGHLLLVVSDLSRGGSVDYAATSPLPGPSSMAGSTLFSLRSASYSSTLLCSLPPSLGFLPDAVHPPPQENPCCVFLCSECVLCPFALVPENLYIIRQQQQGEEKNFIDMKLFGPLLIFVQIKMMSLLLAELVPLGSPPCFLSLLGNL